MKSDKFIPKWVTSLTNENFLAVYDVTMDICSELQLSAEVAIPLLPTIVKFPMLMPGDGVNMRDRYCEYRWKACGLLKKQGVIQNFNVLQGAHRWESRLQIVCEEKDLIKLKEWLDAEYKERNGSQKPKERGDSLPNPKSECDAVEDVRRLILRFHTVSIQLRQRHDSRPTLDVSDEYDVQDLLHALLCLQFDDVRPEEWTPSYAGKSARVDFLLKPEDIVIEVKKTRAGLGAKEVGDQLILDIARYSKMKSCKTLICMVYDPENRIINPGGLESDLSGKKDGLRVEAIIVPKRY